MGTRVKICGNASEADALAVAALAPDFMGYIFWPGSKRFVTPESVRDWSKNLPLISRVGVFVNATPDEVRRAVEIAGLTAVQLHGGEEPDVYRGIAPQLWQVVKIVPQLPELGNDCPENFQSRELPASVDAILLDTLVPNVPGGTGQTGDWKVAKHYVNTARRRVLLAGGLTPANVASAIRMVAPWGVDVSSGVESAPARKDVEKVAAFIQAARNYSNP